MADGRYISEQDWPDLEKLLSEFRANGRTLRRREPPKTERREHVKLRAAIAKGTHAVGTTQAVALADDGFEETTDEVDATNNTESAIPDGTKFVVARVRPLEGFQIIPLSLGGGTEIKLGKTDAALAKGSAGTVSIYAGVPGGESDTGDNVTATNKFANVASGKWVAVAYFNGNWYLISAEC